jgi:hypothetical protein
VLDVGCGGAHLSSQHLEVEAGGLPIQSHPGKQNENMSQGNEQTKINK